MVDLIKKFESPFRKPSSKQRKPSDPSAPNLDIKTVTQSVDAAEIDPEKLMKKLKQRFPSGFKVHVRKTGKIGSRGSLTWDCR